MSRPRVRSTTQILRDIGGYSANIAIVLISTAACFLLLEIIARLVSESVGLFSFENFVSKKLDRFEIPYQAAYHSNLGYIPKPGTRSANNRRGETVTILAHGIRSNGDDTPHYDAPGSTILAVGDSFTFGYQISDGDTWPAHLEKQLNRRVLNGGVFGYGLDQIVLRAEELPDLFDLKTIIISFIPDDIDRTQLSIRAGVPKPYFVVEGGHLVRKNQPVSHVRPAKDRIGLLRSILGYSYVINWIMRRLGLTEWWLVGQWDTREVHSQGMRVSCLLTKRLRTLGLRADARIIMVAQYGKETVFDDQESAADRARARNLLKCAKSNGLEILDLYEPLLKVYQSDPDRYDSYYRGHMTAAGNRFVAERIAHYLGRQ